MTTLADVKPEQRPYEPRGAARDLFYCHDTEVLIEGPAGTGKTRAALEKLFLCCDKYAGMRALIVRKTRESMSETVLHIFEEHVVPLGHMILEGAARRFRQLYRFANGSIIVVGGMDKPEKIMSGQFDMVAAFETTELTENDWERLLTRLRNGVVPYQQAIADCNPGPPRHWLNLRANEGGMTRLPSRHKDNPTLYSQKRGEWTDEGQAYMEKLHRLTGVRALRLVKGQWAAAEGMVYDEWDSAVHICDRFDIPDDWRRVRVIDFGYTNPFVCQWWAIDPDGRMYRYRELYGPQRLVEDWAGDIRRYSEGESIEVTIADHDAEDRATLERRGVSTLPAYKAISTGIEAVKARLRIAGDGRPRLFLMRDSLVRRDPALDESGSACCTEEEIESYVWPRGQDGKANKEEPVKAHDHGMDAMRYAVCRVDHIGSGDVDVRVITMAKPRAKCNGQPMRPSRRFV